jgi:type IX secretion system PorP/SprF family membrane protein
MKKAAAIFSLVLSALSGFSQHNPLQSQYMMNPLVINPAYAGERNLLSTTVSYRRQWQGFDGAPETFAFTAHTPLKNHRFNVGLVASQDNLAVLHRTQVEAIYTYRIHARKYSLAAGFSPGIIFQRNNWNEIITTEQGDASFMTAERSTSFQAGLGIYFSTSQFFAGISTRTVLSKSVKPSVKSQPVNVYTGYTFGRPTQTAVTISALGRMIPGSFFQADLNILVYLRDRIGFGASYRLNDAVAGILSLKVNEQFNLGYSYDFTISRLRNYNSGSHELVLRYDFGYKINPKSPRNF